MVLDVKLVIFNVERVDVVINNFGVTSMDFFLDTLKSGSVETLGNVDFETSHKRESGNVLNPSALMIVQSSK